MSPLISPRRRDLVLVLVAVALLTGPFLGTLLHLGEPTYQYGRTEITVDDTSIEYTDAEAVPRHVRISEAIGCLNGQEARICAFEELLLQNQTIPTDAATNNPSYNPSGFSAERYRYVLVNETVYRSVYVPNESVQQDNGMYRLDLGLQRIPPDQALQSVSLHVNADSVPSPVAEAARSGESSSQQELEVPKTPIQLENGTYYRVYLEMRNDVSQPARVTAFLLTYGAPVVGLCVVGWLTRQVRVTYTGDEGRRRR